MNAMKSRIRRVLSETLHIPSSIKRWKDDTDIFKLVEINSFSLLRLITALEDEFDVKIDESKITLTVLRSVNELSEFIIESRGKE